MPLELFLTKKELLNQSQEFEFSIIPESEEYSLNKKATFSFEIETTTEYLKVNLFKFIIIIIFNKCFLE